MFCVYALRVNFDMGGGAASRYPTLDVGSAYRKRATIPRSRRDRSRIDCNTPGWTASASVSLGHSTCSGGRFLRSTRRGSPVWPFAKTPRRGEPSL
jgi:hypothetical protein